MYTALKKTLPLALFLAMLFTGVVPVGPESQGASEVVHFGLISTASPQAVTAQWQPLLDDMSKAIGVAVKAKTFDDYAGAVWAMQAGKTQIAWLGNKSAIEAVDRAGAEVAFQLLDMEGKDSYRSHLLAGMDSGLACEQDVFSKASGLTYGDGDPNSTSGHVIPGYCLFTPRLLEPRAIFKRVIQNNHEGNFLSVAEGLVDVATGNSLDFARFSRAYPEKWKRVRILWTSPPIPSDPIVWRTDMPEALKAGIRSFLLGYGVSGPGKSAATLEREQTVLAGMDRSGFRASDNRQLLFIRQIEMRRQRSRIEANAAISDEDRTRQLEQLDQKLQRLESQ